MKKNKPNIPFNEFFLHYIWRTKQIINQQLITTEGKPIEIVHFGHYNEDSGPDFLHGIVKIENTTWVGNIEIHVLSSDWDKHNHQHDKAYDNVILHVVYFYDKEIQQDGRKVPCLSLYNKIPKVLIKRYHELIKSKKWIPCAGVLQHVDPSVFNLWKDRLLLEKLKEKETLISRLLHKYTFDWETCFYILLARYFGGKLNDIPFEALADRTPLDLVRKNADDTLMIQALFFGQSGLLENECIHPYTVTLQSNYRFLKAKYNLTPLQPVVWKFSKLRPPNFPTVRLAEFSTLKNLGSSLFHALCEADNLKTMHELIQTQPDDYWSNHYVFKTYAKVIHKNITNDFRNHLLINAFLPLVFVFAKTYGQDQRIDWILKIFGEMKKENNKIIRQWEGSGMSVHTALDSQALLYLYSDYCSKKHCLSCRIGHQIMKQSPPG